MGWLSRLFAPARAPASVAEQRADKAVKRTDEVVGELQSVAERLDALVGRLEEREEKWKTEESPT